MTYFAFFNGCLVTANKDGSIPLNAKVVANCIPDGNGALMFAMIDAANAHAAQLDAAKEGTHA